MYHTFRLQKGQDLYKEIQEYVVENNIQAGIVLCCVGCVYTLRMRLANGVNILEKEDMYEIVSMTGTLSLEGSHLHISFSDREGHTLGGHLVAGCLINTTAEICLLSLEDRVFCREDDEATGYDELVIYPK